MSRDLVTATANAAQQDTIVPVWFVNLEFDGGNVCLSTYDGPLTWGGDTYTGAGAIGSISQVDEDTELARSTLTMELRGLPDDIVAIVHDEYFQGRRATTRQGYLDINTRQLVGDPMIYHRGRMDTATVDETDTCKVTLSVESRFAAWDTARVRRYNDADQQAAYPGDLGMEFVEQATRGTVYGASQT